MILLLFLSITNVLAHMPVFGKDLHLDDTQTKSWGVYILLEDTYSLTMDVPEGKNVSFSLSVPGWYKEQPNITVELFGHNAKNISCDSEFNGWGTQPEWSERRRLDGDSTKNIPVYKTSQNVFEQFGVGAYRPIAACQGKTVGDTHFKLTITNNVQTTVRLSIGVGMSESFSVEDIVFMSYTIIQSWLWADQMWSLVVPIMGLVSWIGFFLYRIYNTEMSIKLFKQYFGLLCVWFMVVSSLQFTIQLTYTAYYVSIDQLFFPLFVHIIFPVVVCILFYWYTTIVIGDCAGNTKHCVFGVLFVLYTFTLLWQGYCVALVGFIGYFILKFVDTNEYNLISEKNNI